MLPVPLGHERLTVPETEGTSCPLSCGHWEASGGSLGDKGELSGSFPLDAMGYNHTSLLLQDYVFTEGDLVFQPGETRKEVQIPLLELTEIDTLLHNSQLKQFAVDLLHPKYGAKIGRYPQTTVTIADPGRGWQSRGGKWQQGVWDSHTIQAHPRWCTELQPCSSLKRTGGEVPPAPTGRFGPPSRGVSGYRQWVGRRWIIYFAKGNSGFFIPFPRGFE